jgi:putative ABC transport system permease protein
VGDEASCATRMKTIRQFIALLDLSLSSLKDRLGSVLVTVIGTACVVGVLISMLSIGAGARAMIMHNARADRVWVLKHGSHGTGDSSLSREAVLAIADMPGVRKDVDGRAMAYGATFVGVEGRKKIDNARTTFALFGVGAAYTAVHPEFHLTAGRMFQPGLRELIAGKSRYELFKNFEIGDHVRLRGNEWTVVGHFETGGFFDGSLLADAPTVMSVFGISTFNNATLMLQSAAAFDELQAAVKANPSLDVELRPEIPFMREQSKNLSGVLDFVSYFVGAVMAAGATLGAVNSMYAIVDSRKREIATLRAIGFGAGPVILAVLTEAVLLVLPGAILGVLAAWSLFNGNRVSPIGMSFRLTVTPDLVALGVAWALSMGLIGGLLPALRAARASVTTALRAN